MLVPWPGKNLLQALQVVSPRVGDLRNGGLADLVELAGDKLPPVHAFLPRVKDLPQARLQEPQAEFPRGGELGDEVHDLLTLVRRELPLEPLRRQSPHHLQHLLVGSRQLELVDPGEHRLERVVAGGQRVDGEDDPPLEAEGRRHLELAAVVVHQAASLLAFPKRASQYPEGWKYPEHGVAVVEEHDRLRMLVQRHVHRQGRTVSREDDGRDPFLLQRRQHDPRLAQSPAAAVDAQPVRHPPRHQTHVVGEQLLPLFETGRGMPGDDGKKNSRCGRRLRGDIVFLAAFCEQV